MRGIRGGAGHLLHDRKKRFSCSFISVVSSCVLCYPALSFHCPFIVIFVREARLKQKLGPFLCKEVNDSLNSYLYTLRTYFYLDFRYFTDLQKGSSGIRQEGGQRVLKFVYCAR